MALKKIIRIKQVILNTSMWYIEIGLTMALFGEWIEEVSFRGGGELDVLPYWGNKNEIYIVAMVTVTLTIGSL